MNKFNKLASALIIGSAMLSGVASAANYSPNYTLSPLPGELWGTAPTIRTSTGSFEDAYSFSFSAPTSVSFTATGNYGTTFNSFAVEWAGAAPSGAVLTHASNASNTAGGTWSGSFTAAAGTTYALRVHQDQGAIDYGSYNFSLHGTVPAVPEPETFAMLLAGLGLVSMVSRRRQTKSLLAA